MANAGADVTVPPLLVRPGYPILEARTISNLKVHLRTTLGAGEDVTVVLVRNGSAEALSQVVLNGPLGDGNTASSAFAPIAFAVNDDLDVRLSGSGLSGAIKGITVAIR